MGVVVESLWDHKETSLGRKLWDQPSLEVLVVNKTEILAELQAFVWRHLGLFQLTLPKRL